MPVTRPPRHPARPPAATTASRDPSRRDALAIGGAGLISMLTGCSDVHSDSGIAVVDAHPDGAVGSQAVLDDVEGEITFAFWGGSAGERRGFERVKQAFETANPKARVTFLVEPYSGFFSGIERGLQAGRAPDVFRVDYTNVGHYASKGVLLDLTTYFTHEEMTAFTPSLWKAITYQGVPFGVPHQVDVSALVYDKAVLARAGITDVPTRLSEAWTWQEFADVATRLRAHLPASSFPFAYDWTKAGAYRWFSWLYQAGGSVVDEAHRRSGLNAAAGLEALDFTRSFFTRGWVPDTNTIKGSKFSDEFFMGKIAPMAFVGDFLMPSIADPKTGYADRWGVTCMPRSHRAATDLGGNAIVANRAARHPRVAAAFLKFLVREDMMRQFCEQANELPTLTSLRSDDLDYAVAAEQMRVFSEQATTLDDTITREVTLPGFNRINVVMQDELERAFTDRTARTEQIAGSIARRVETVMGWRA